MASKDKSVRCAKCRAAFAAREEEPPGGYAPRPRPAGKDRLGLSFRLDVKNVS